MAVDPGLDTWEAGDDLDRGRPRGGEGVPFGTGVPCAFRHHGIRSGLRTWCSSCTEHLDRREETHI